MNNKLLLKHLNLTVLQLTVFIVIFISCLGKKNFQEVKGNAYKFKVNFNISAYTKFLIHDIEKELKDNKVVLKNYVPSKFIVDTYSMMNINDIYHISGMAFINDKFVSTSLNKYQIKSGTTAGKVITLQIPINKLDSFFMMNDIEYFQISEKVDLK